MDGTEHSSSFNLAFPFDRAVVLGRYWVVYVERGTKALLLKDGKILRELNRSFYCAHAYDYPVALATLPGGRVVVIHCPDDYNVLQIEDAETGARLSERNNESSDVFHSRLEVSPDGRRLLAVGWFWHPFGIAKVFDLAEAQRDPAQLDGEGDVALANGVEGEVASGCWLDAERIALATAAQTLDDRESPGLGAGELGVWSCAESAWVQRHRVGFPLGQLLACGESVISLHGHPRQISVGTGEVLAEWPEVALPERELCYDGSDLGSPVAAVHPDGTRLAVAQESGIWILNLI